MLPGRPSLLRDEESMFDRVSRNLCLSFRTSRAGRAHGVTPIGLDATLRESHRAAAKI